LFDLALDAREPSTNSSVFSNFLEVVCVFVDDNVSAVHKSRYLDMFFNPLVDQTEDGVSLRVAVFELEIKAQFLVLNIDADQEERWLDLFFTGGFRVELLVHDFEIMEDSVGDAVSDAFVDEIDVFLPFA
jgi:hypothetical protein